MTDRYFQILEDHKVYDSLSDANSIRFFLERHVVCVWLYQSLLEVPLSRSY